jgi:hypothetical protein
MYHRWQRIHCDRCLEEQLREDLAEISPRRGRQCTHGAHGFEPDRETMAARPTNRIAESRVPAAVAATK